MHFERLYVCMGQVNVYKELRRSWKGLELGEHDTYSYNTWSWYVSVCHQSTKMFLPAYSQRRDRHKCRHLFECFSRQDTEHVSTVSLSELNIYNILNVWQVSFLFETQTFSKWKYTNFEKKWQNSETFTLGLTNICYSHHSTLHMDYVLQVCLWQQTITTA